MRDNWRLSDRMFKDCEDIVAHCCAAWNKLVDSHGTSCPSASATGQISHDRRPLVLRARRGASL